MGQEPNGTKARRRNLVRWTRIMRAAFLDHLAATCNVRGAARVIGVDAKAVYRLRRRDPAFAANWQVALALGYEMLETRLVGHALAGERGVDLIDGPDSELEPISVPLALTLLKVHRDARGKPRRSGVPKYAAPEETDKVLMAKLAQLEARRAAQAAAEDAA